MSFAFEDSASSSSDAPPPRSAGSGKARTPPRKRVRFDNQKADTSTAAAATTNNQQQQQQDDDSFDDDLLTEARRAFAAIDKSALQVSEVYGLDFDNFKAIGAASTPLRGRGVATARRLEQVEKLVADAEAMIAGESYEEAFRTCIEAVRVSPRSKEPYELLALIMERKEPPDHRHAVDYLSLACQFHKKDVGLWLRVADKATHAQLFANATIALRMVLKYADADAGVDRTAIQMQLALCYELNREDDKAQREALALLRASTASHYQAMEIARLVYKYGEVERAVAYMGQRLGLLQPADTDFRSHYANFLATMYRENYLHQECVVFLGLLIGAPREQYDAVVRQLVDEARTAAQKEHDAARDKPSSLDISARNIPAMLPRETCEALGLLTPAAAAAAAAVDEDDEEAALFGSNSKKPLAQLRQATSTANTRVYASDGTTLLLHGNVALGDDKPSIDLITAYACSLAECCGLAVARPLMDFILAYDNEFDLHINIARTMLEKQQPLEARDTFERIFNAMQAAAESGGGGGGGGESEPPVKQLALLLSLYQHCCATLRDPQRSLWLHERALAAFPTHEPIVACVAEELERHGDYERARAVLHVFYEAEFRRTEQELATADHELVLQSLIARYPKLVAMYFMMSLFAGLDTETFRRVGVAILSSNEFMHAPLSTHRWNKVTAQRAHLRARQGAGVGGEVQSLIVALGPVLFADLCAQVGYFLADSHRDEAFRCATNALSAQRAGSVVDGQSRRLTRVVQFDAQIVARLAWIAVRSAPNSSERQRYARLMIKHAPNSAFVWQLLVSDPSMHAHVGALTSEGEKQVRAQPTPPQRAAATPLTARALQLMRTQQLPQAARVLHDALERRPAAPLPALLLAITATRQAHGANAHADALTTLLAHFQRYVALRLPEDDAEHAPPPESQTEQVVHISMRRSEVAYNVARALHSIGFHAHAEAFYLNAIEELRGDSAQLLVRLAAHNLSLLYEQRGEHERAAHITERFLNLA